MPHAATHALEGWLHITGMNTNGMRVNHVIVHQFVLCSCVRGGVSATTSPACAKPYSLQKWQLQHRICVIDHQSVDRRNVHAQPGVSRRTSADLGRRNARLNWPQRRALFCCSYNQRKLEKSPIDTSHHLTLWCGKHWKSWCRHTVRPCGQQRSSLASP